MGNWWRINKKERAVYDIEWSSKTGQVRARLNGPTKKTVWEYADAYDASHAEWVGFDIITRHRRGQI